MEDGGGSTPIRVLIVDDHEMVRVGLAAMLGLADGFEVCGEAATAAEAEELALATGPDVVLLDVRLADADVGGIEAARRLRRAVPASRVVMITGLSREADVVAASMAGAVGFLQKTISRQGLLDALRRIADGEVLFDQELTASVLARLQDSEEVDPRIAALSDREREILRLVSDGRSNREIADLLHLSEKTVKNHVTHVLAKLGVHRRTEAVSLYIGQR